MDFERGDIAGGWNYGIDPVGICCLGLAWLELRLQGCDNLRLCAIPIWFDLSCQPASVADRAGSKSASQGRARWQSVAAVLLSQCECAVVV